MSILARMPVDRVRVLVASCLAAATLPASVARAEPEVIAVVACDGYSDLRKQLAWFGTQVGNPTLVILAESMLTGITGGRGLVGLDVKRPFGVVLTADGNAVGGSAFLPVTDVDKLLGSLAGVVGPAEADGNDRKITVPAGGVVRVVTKNGWAILTPDSTGRNGAGPKTGVDDPTEWISPLSEDFTLAVRLFPSRMPLPLREQLAKQIEAASARSAQMGQPVDPTALVAALGSLGDVESITLGLRLDDAKNRLLVEMRSVGLPGSAAAKAAATLGGSPLTVPMPKSAGKTMARGFVAQQIPPEAAAQIGAVIDASSSVDSSDPITKLLAGSMRSVAKAAVASGRLDGSMALVNAAAEGEPPSIEFTSGMHVKDGAGLERSLRKLLGPDAELPPIVKVKLDDGRVGDATLHSLSVDLAKSGAAAMLGKTLQATIAVAPEACHILVGGDARARLEQLRQQPAPPAQDGRPMAAVQVSADQWLAVAAEAAKGSGAGEAERLAAAAKAAAASESSIVQLQVRPIERGVAWQVSADSGVLKAAAAASGMGAGGGGGLPIGVGPLGGAAR